jgi:hypothetical protein
MFFNRGVDPSSLIANVWASYEGLPNGGNETCEIIIRKL